ncbi:unnamed protein product [Parnassius apollo]|uniref:(apollo) hypothetical protein n=1 Tax=Parnassius apollo TaxID=110799 RepID=A0A8S3Y4W3_PARAO|nr:unnamed protein product [Parnassius apollo]
MEIYRKRKTTRKTGKRRRHKKKKRRKRKKNLDAQTKQTKQKVPVAKLKIKKEHERVNADVKKIVPPEKLDTADISLVPPANVDYTPIEKQEDKENCIDYASLIPKNKDIKQNKFLTEFDTYDV